MTDKNYWSSESGEANADDLKERDDTSDSQHTDQAAEDEQQHLDNSPASAINAATSPQNLFNRLENFSGITRNATKKKLAAVLGIFGIPIMLAIFLFFMFAGQLKSIHFATIMRSSSFAAFQMTMNKAYRRVVFDRAILTDASTGKVKIKRDLLDITHNRLEELGKKDQLKLTANKSGDVTEVIINDTKFNFDDYAKKSFGKTFDQLNLPERMVVQARIGNAMDEPLSEVIGNKNLWYRATSVNAIRMTAHISTIKWVNKGKEYVGKKLNEAMKLATTERMERINTKPVSAVGKKSTMVSEDEYAKEIAETVRTAENGENTSKVKMKAARPTELQAKLNGGAAKVSLVITLTTIACIINDLDNSFKEMQQTREVNALRTAHEDQTMLDQAKMGETVNEAMSAENQGWGDATASPWYKMDVGEALTDQDREQIQQIPSIFPTNNFVKAIEYANQITDLFSAGIVNSAVGNMIPGYREQVRENKTAACNVLMNEATQVIITAGELALAWFTGGLYEVAAQGVRGMAGFLFMGLAGEQIDNAVAASTKNIGGIEYSGLATGSERYNESRAGLEYMAQINNRRMAFGALLSDEDAVAVQKTAMAEQKKINQTQSPYQRYFAISNPSSLLSRIIISMPSTPSSVMATLGNAPQTIGSLLKTSVNTAGSMVFPKAFAADDSDIITGTNVGVKVFGYTQDEMNKIDSDPSFMYDALKAYLEPKMEALDAKYMPCYEPVLQSELPDMCKNSSDFYKGDEALKWRWYHALETARTESEKPLSDFVGKTSPVTP